MLTDVLKLHFGWNLARIKCLSCLIIALFKVKTVNFAELATAFSGSAKPDSHYRRIQRFFKEVKIRPRSWDRPLYAFRGGFKGAGASSTDSKIAANIERGLASIVGSATWPP